MHRSCGVLLHSPVLPSFQTGSILLTLIITRETKPTRSWTWPSPALGVISKDDPGSKAQKPPHNLCGVMICKPPCESLPDCRQRMCPHVRDVVLRTDACASPRLFITVSSHGLISRHPRSVRRRLDGRPFYCFC